ncbi:MAG: hypothetical protein LC792_17720 [Actinobacteria bacterium]|nr:hypothetical protein [Actinomycetota bacterium]
MTVASLPRAVAVCCPRCALRYSGVVDPACPDCLGAGRLAAVIGDRDAWVAARALELLADRHGDELADLAEGEAALGALGETRRPKWVQRWGRS